MVGVKYLIVHLILHMKRMTCEISWDLQNEFRPIIPDTSEEVDEGVCSCESDSDLDYCDAYNSWHVAKDIPHLVEDKFVYCCYCGCHDSLKNIPRFKHQNINDRCGITFYDALEIPLIVNFHVDKNSIDLINLDDLNKQNFRDHIVRSSSTETITVQLEADSSGININTSNSSLADSESSGSDIDLSQLKFCTRSWPTCSSLHEIDDVSYIPQPRTLTMDHSTSQELLPTFRITPPDSLGFTNGKMLPAPYQSPTLTTVEESASEMDESDSKSVLETSTSSDPFSDIYHQTALQVHVQNSYAYNICEYPWKSRGHSYDTSSQTSPEHNHCSRDSDDASSVSSAASPRMRRRRRHGTTSIDIDEVKELTSRLNLVTRRPSVQAWQQAHFCGSTPKRMTSQTQDSELINEKGGPEWSHDFRDRINSSLDWLTAELTAMKEQDALLARQLLNIRKDMYKLKLQRSVQRHQMILEEAMEIEEERDEYQQSNDSDLPPDLFSPTLKQYGVTRMHLSARRFSVF